MYRITTFQLRHLALLCKCTGGSLISGAVNNGFFERRIHPVMVAIIGMVLFIIGNFIDEHLTAQDNPSNQSVWDIVLMGIFLSLGIGFFTGAIQHIAFPKLPIAVWVTPLGLILTIAGLGWKFKDNLLLIKRLIYYSTMVTALVTALSFAKLYWLDNRTIQTIDSTHKINQLTPYLNNLKSKNSDQFFLNPLQKPQSKAHIILQNSHNNTVKTLTKPIINHP